MTRKDYIALAHALKSARPASADLFECDIYARIVARLSLVLAGDNPRFDSARFCVACGVAPNALIRIR